MRHWTHCRTDIHKNGSPTFRRRLWIFNHRSHCSWTRSCSRSVCAKPPSGSSPVPGGCTNEMLRLCLEDNDLFQLLHSDFASGAVPPTSGPSSHVGHHDCSPERVRRGQGIATGLMLARQFGKEVEAACSPFQLSLSTRAGTDCVGHVIRALTDANLSLTVTSIDGVGANDHVNRSATLSKLLEVLKLRGLLPFARFACAEPTSCVWEDEGGVRHHIRQGKGRSRATL